MTRNIARPTLSRTTRVRVGRKVTGRVGSSGRGADIGVFSRGVRVAGFAMASVLRGGRRGWPW
ncbi:hypothetical protein SMICM304S_11713 [Streptomyces microflavus]